MKTKHTPGQWKIHGESYWKDNRLVRQICVDDRQICIVHASEITEQNTDMSANARLISAAPDLLEACKEAIRIIHNDAYVNDLLKKAISKAEGK